MSPALAMAMGSPSPRTKATLRALEASHSARTLDLVESWKGAVLTKLRREQRSLASKSGVQPPMRLRFMRLLIGRRRHALIFSAFAIGVAATISGLRLAPLWTFAVACLAISTTRAASDAFKEDRDQNSGVAQKSDEAAAALAAGNPAQATMIARAALQVARSPAQHRRLWTTLAWSGIAQREPFLTHLALQQLPTENIDLHLLSSYLSCCNRTAEAQQLLLAARELGQRSAETSKHLIELSFAQGDLAAALALAESDAALLSARDQAAITEALAIEPTASPRSLSSDDA
jgi:hypothetical protein